MAILRSTEISRMSKKEIEDKVKELKMELIKDKINISKGGKNRIREIKRTLARLLTFSRLNKPVENK